MYKRTGKGRGGGGKGGGPEGPAAVSVTVKTMAVCESGSQLSLDTKFSSPMMYLPASRNLSKC